MTKTANYVTNSTESSTENVLVNGGISQYLPVNYCIILPFVTGCLYMLATIKLKLVMTGNTKGLNINSSEQELICVKAYLVSTLQLPQ